MPDARLVGSGRLRYFGLSVYDASLWAPPDFRATAFANQRFALSLTYLRTFSANEIAQRTLQEIRRVHDVSPDLASVWLTALQNVLPDGVARHRSTGLHPQGCLALWHQERKMGHRGDAPFGLPLCGMWCGVCLLCIVCCVLQLVSCQCVVCFSVFVVCFVLFVVECGMCRVSHVVSFV